LASLDARASRDRACAVRAAFPLAYPVTSIRRVACGGNSTRQCYRGAVKAHGNWALNGPQKCVKIANIGSEPAIAVDNEGVEAWPD